MLGKLVDLLLLLIACGVIWLWQKIKAWRHPGEKPDEPEVSRPVGKGPVITHGVAGWFVESPPSTLPGTKEYDEVRGAVLDYPQTREGAQAFLTAMAKERDGSWVSTAVVGVADDNEDRAMREDAIKRMRPLEEVSLYSQAEDSDEEDDGIADNSEPESGENWVSVEFIGDRLGFLEPALAAEIVLAKEDESNRRLSFVLEITGTSGQDRGIEIGILRWKERTEADAAEENDETEAA